MENVEIVNPSDTSKFSSLITFAKDNSIEESIDFSLNRLQEAKNTFKKKIILYKNEGKLTDLCYIECEEDLKHARIFLPRLMKSRSKFIKAITNYILPSEEVNDLLINADSNDEYLKKALEESNFLSLGPNDDGSITYYLERETILNSEKVM